MKENSNMPVSSFSLFTPSKNAFMKNFKTFAIVLAPSAINELFSFVNGFGATEPVDVNADISMTMFLVFVVGFLVLLPLLITLGALTTKLQLESAKGNVIAFKELWGSTKSRIVPFFNLSISVAIRVLGGLLLFVVPGIIAIKKYILSPYIFMEDNSISPSDAMKKSAEMSKGPHMGYVWGVVGVTILLSLFGVIPFIGSLISFVLTSLYSVAMPLRYLELKKLAKTD